MVNEAHLSTNQCADPDGFYPDPGSDFPKRLESAPDPELNKFYRNFSLEFLTYMYTVY
jgi:hypothetical protein